MTFCCKLNKTERFQIEMSYNSDMLKWRIEQQNLIRIQATPSDSDLVQRYFISKENEHFIGFMGIT